jgi:small subunit ribosomal protein S35
MTEARRTELEEYRNRLAVKERQRQVSGQLIDGIRQIEEGLRKPAQVETEPEMVVVGKGKGKGAPKRLTVRR